MQRAVLEVVLSPDVLDNTSVLQAGPIQHCLAAVLSQAHLLEPLHEVAAEETLRHGLFSTPSFLHDVMKTLLFVVLCELDAGHPDVLR